ncbi:MAG TPA: hypothetical protein VF598_03940 [Hymenobacter sp.]|jgi:hypothetical protein
MQEIQKPKPGRPKQLAPAGRDLEAEQKHLAAWWVIRPGGKPSGREVARRLEVTEGYIRHFLAGTRPANVLQLENLQRILSAYGYEPPTSYHQFL